MTDIKKQEDKNRGTGRTTRMLRDALIEVLQGNTVFVAGWREADTDHMLHMFLTLPGIKDLKPSVYHTRREIDFGKGRMIFRPISHGDFDWAARRFHHCDPKHTVYIDHYAREKHWEEERRRAINAAKAARMAEARKGPRTRDGFSEDPEAT